MDPNQLPLRDLHLPPPVDWWPLAPGWWLVLALVLLALAWLVRRAWHKRRFLAPRRHAVRALAEIEAAYLEHRNPVVLARQASELLRRSMLAYAPRHEVAGLTGEPWLAWLDRDLPVPWFHTEGGKSLLQLPYRDPEGDYNDVDINAMLAAIRVRLATPVGGTH
jgi:Domain of unknown function (DUF4381)